MARGGPPREAAAAEAGERRLRDLLGLAPMRRILITAGLLETGNELVNFLLPIYGHSVGLSPSQIGLLMGGIHGETRHAD